MAGPERPEKDRGQQTDDPLCYKAVSLYPSKTVLSVVATAHFNVAWPSPLGKIRLQFLLK